jgi:O-antigen/teichoic acid export membrane protein
MGEPRSELEVKRAALERKNTIATLVALAVWLGLSFLGEALFIGQNERLDAGAIFVMGGGPILLISALHLLFSRILSRGLVIRSIIGIILLGTGVGELTDLSKGVIWGSVGGAVLAVIVASILWRVFRRK